MKIYVISDQYRGIKTVFDRSHFGWSIEHGEAIHHYCMQHIAKKLYKEVERAGERIISKLISKGG
jgi:hypothetical protein